MVDVNIPNDAPIPKEEKGLNELSTTALVFLLIVTVVTPIASTFDLKVSEYSLFSLLLLSLFFYQISKAYYNILSRDKLSKSKLKMSYDGRDINTAQLKVFLYSIFNSAIAVTLVGLNPDVKYVLIWPWLAMCINLINVWTFVSEKGLKRVPKLTIKSE